MVACQLTGFVLHLTAQPGCRKRPGYNFPGESTTGKYCSQHKLDGMVDVKHKPCQYEGCTKRPYFNYQGESHGILCNEHKQPGMINVGQAPCAEPGCHLAPSFNFPGQKKRLFCAQHKLEGMVNISQQPRGAQQVHLKLYGLRLGVSRQSWREQCILEPENRVWQFSSLMRMACSSAARYAAYQL